MSEITIANVRAFLKEIEGQTITLDKLRSELHIEKYDLQTRKITKSFDSIRCIVRELEDQKLLRLVSRAEYMVVKQVLPLQVFGVERERRPPYELFFPRDFNTGEEMWFAKDVVIREGDLVLISGMSNFGKTTVCLNFGGENIDKHPVLMGNEYTVMVDKTETTPQGFDVSPRFQNKLDTMSVLNVDGGGWVDWLDANGNDKFTLLPVWADYAEHIVKNKINIIDWINLPGEYYLISPIMEAIKKSLGRGIGILAIQKNEGNTFGRGGAMTRDFADLELLIDRFGDSEVLLTLGKVKEATRAVVGKHYAYSISEGVKIHNFREMKKCPECRGTGYKGTKHCEHCYTLKYVEA